ncbi:uncharacterized protein LOC111372262 [Olea europaea var. sylvestris]|uniref:uncharacterized protein LOC111372262 n=1 Tax=Olea europaea var. sylvestris TaxID=158386 RepID=UPI000C1D1A7E|nr:uncharacterized protein LOC111372262 [Olea europaea var. sylvestris]
MKRDKMAKRSSFGNIVRSLSNITNSLLNLKSHATVKKLPSDSASGKDFIDQLGKENVGLLKLVRDKNKIIELLKIQNLREMFRRCSCRTGISYNQIVICLGT